VKPEGPGSHLNGYRVDLAVKRPDGTYVVLVDRGTAPPNQHPYVTAIWYPECGDSWNLGHYFTTRRAALIDFGKREAA